MYWLLCVLFQTLIMSKLIRGTFRLPCCCMGSSVSGSPYCDRHLADSLFTVHSLLRLAAEVTGNSLAALLASHSYHVHTHICLCLRTPGLYIMIVNLTFRHCFNVFDGSVFILTKCHSARGIWVSMKAN